MDATDLPREIQDLIGSNEQSSGQMRLDKLAALICNKRDDAILARKSSGIEDTWVECEEAYLGIDDENRHEFIGSRWIKPTVMQAPITTDASSRRTNSSNVIRATAFVRMTSRLVNVGAAKIGEITLPIDDKAFSFTATPNPSLIFDQSDLTPIMHPEHGKLTRPATTDEMALMQPPPDPNAPPPEVPLTKADLAKEKIEFAETAAKKAETRIYDWMVESRYPAEMRKVQFDAARIGVGILKGPFPVVRKDRALTMSADGKTKKLTFVERVAPGYKWIDPWNFYPSGECGEDIHSGNHVLEVDRWSSRTVEDLKDNPAYMKACVAKVLAMGPSSKVIHDNDRPILKSQVKEDGRYEVWQFYGLLTKEDIETCVECGLDAKKNGVPTDKESVFVIVTLINDTVVRVTINPLESGEFCYHVMPWSRRTGHWAGVGVAEQIRAPQRMCNAATRMMLVNAAKAAGSQIVMSGAITPMDGNWNIYPDKLWRMNPDATVKDVREAFVTFQFPSAQKEMMGIIEYSFKLAEETSNIPLLSQGQSGKTTPDTLGGQQLQDNNANQLLRAVGYIQDDTITEPVVLQSYEWLLLDEDVPNDEKGDWKINAHGSAAMVERYIQNQQIPMLLQLSANPIYGLDPKLTAAQSIKSQRLDPRDFKYTDAEQQKIDKMRMVPAPDLQIAQLRAASQEKIAASHDNLLTVKTKADTDRDTAYNNSLAERDRIAAAAADKRLALEERKLEQQIQLAMLEYANQNKTTLQQVKADLAKTAMIENTRKELAAAEIALAQSEGMHQRTHEKVSQNDEIRVNSTQPNSLVRDEMSTNVTP